MKRAPVSAESLSPKILAAAIAEATDEIREAFRPPPNTLFLHKKQMEVYANRSRFKVVVAGRRWGKCARIGTRIAMADGSYREIQNVIAGESVLTINETTYRLEAKTVQHVLSNGVKETLAITTKSGKRLVVTPNHPLLINNTWTESQFIKAGDLIATPRATVFGTEELPQHEIDFLAIWLAEGDRHGYTNQTPSVIRVMEDAASALGCEFIDKVAVGDSERKRGLYWRWRGIQPGKNGCLDLLRKYRLTGTTAKTKLIPETIFKLPQHQLVRFLNLFLATDGCINRRSKSTWAVEIALANERMVHQLAELFLKFGVRGQISHKVHKQCSRVTGEPFQSWRFIASERQSVLTVCQEIGALGKEAKCEAAVQAAAASAGSCNDYMPIKHDEFARHLRYEPVEKGRFGGYNASVARDLPETLRQQLTSWRKQTPERISTRRYANLRGFSDGHFDSMADGSLAWDEVVSIEAAGEIQTFDLMVEGNHNFIAEGLVTHNTQLAKVSLIKFARRRNRLVWYVAPSYRMARQIMWPALVESIPRAWVRKYHETLLSIHLINGSTIELKGADNPDSLRGVGVHYLVMDEVQDIEPDAWKKVLRPTLASTGGHAMFIGCVTGDTKVMTRSGLVRIDSFATGSKDKILDPLSVDLYGIDRSFHHANGFWNNGEVETRRIKTVYGFQIESSLPHPVWVRDSTGKEVWKRTQDISPGDRIIIARGMEQWPGIDPLTGWAERVAAWRISFVNKRGPKPSSVRVDGMTDDLARFLGLWLAEGSVEVDVGRITITCGDPEIGAFLESGRVLGLKFKARTGRTDQWAVNSYEMVEMMRHLDMPLVKAPGKRLPAWLWSGKRQWACAALAGMFDGDGYVSSTCFKAGYTSSSEKLAGDVQLLLTNLGVIGKLSAVKSEPTLRVLVPSMQYRLEIHGSDLSRLKTCLPLLIPRKLALLNRVPDALLSRRDGIPFVLSLLELLKREFIGDKRKSIAKAIQSARGGSDVTYETLRTVLLESLDFAHTEAHLALTKLAGNWYYYDEVVSSDQSHATTYDFTIPQTHSFWSNGFISHNTPKAYNFLHELWKQGQRAEPGAWASWQFPTITSPFIPGHEIAAARADMDEKSFRQEFEACHLPETEVVLWSGKVKRIKDIASGDTLQHLSGDGVLYPCDVLKIGETGLKQVVDVTIETGEVISASNHHKFKVHASE